MKRMGWVLGFVVLTVLGAQFISSVPAYGVAKLPPVRFRLDTVGGVSALTHDHVPAGVEAMQASFPAAMSNLELWTTLTEGVDLYAEWYLSSKHHPGQLFDHEGYILVTKLPESLNIGGINWLFDYINIKAGNFELDYGNNHLVRSDNGQVDQNPLIGNYVADPNTVEGGFEVIGNYGMLHGVVGIGDGVTTEDNRASRGFSRHAKIWTEPEDKLYNVALSYYYVDHSGNPTAAGKGTWSELFAGNRSGSQYAGTTWAAVGTTPAGATTDSEYAQPAMGNGQKVTAYQLDAALNLPRITLSGMYGYTTDDDFNGSAAGTPQDTWTYYGIEGKANATKNFYLAGRYSNASSSSYKGTSASAFVDRMQIGVGYWVADSILLKTEYMMQRYRDFPADYTTNPNISGLTMQILTMLPF